MNSFEERIEQFHQVENFNAFNYIVHRPFSQYYCTKYNYHRNSSLLFRDRTHEAKLKIKRKTENEL